jgi:hypothetical protein
MKNAEGPLSMRDERAPPLGSFAEWISRPRGYGMSAFIAIVGTWPMVDACAPVANYLPVAYWIVEGLPIALLVIVLRATSLALVSLVYRHQGWKELYSWGWGLCLSAVLGLSWMLGIPIRSAFYISYPAFEHARQLNGRAGRQRVGLYPVYGIEKPFGNEIVAVYTEATFLGVWGSGLGVLPNSGSGFLYVPPAEIWPAFSCGNSGYLGSGWYWFTTE